MTKFLCSKRIKNMAYCPKRAVAELRHSGSSGARASSSPMKRDGDDSPLIPDTQPNDDDDDDSRGRHAHKDRDRPFWSYFQSLCPFLSDDARVSPHSSRIPLFVLIFVVLVGLISIFSIAKRLVSPLPYFMLRIWRLFECLLIVEKE